MTEQLQMIWPEGREIVWAERQVPAGYLLRVFRDGDQEAYIDLMRIAGFDTWTRDNLDLVVKNAVPNGIISAEHAASTRLAATAMGWRKSTAIFPDGYEMGWLAADPAHRGKGLGELVVAAVTRTLLSHGARHIFLLTDDWRLPAINGYLKVGYVPLYHTADMKMRWHDVFRRLSLKMEEYPGVDLVGDG
jgi:mycothiol synthase